MQPLFDTGQQRIFCSLDCKHCNDSTFPTFLISQAEACDVEPMRKVYLLMYILYNVWNAAVTCLG